MVNCQRCGFKGWRKTGKVKDGNRRGWACGRCGNVQYEQPPFERIEPKCLYIDLETSLSKIYNFGLRVRGEFIPPELLINEWYIICYSASWVGESKVYSECVTPAEARKWSDKRILKTIWGLIDSADLIAGHNVQAFDLKRLSTRFKLNGMSPPLGYKTIDTLKIARSKFSFESNKLDYIAQRLGFRPKDSMHLSDWRKIADSGDEKTLARMQKYNRGDVTEGKRVLAELLEWSGTPVDYGMKHFQIDTKDKRMIK